MKTSAVIFAFIVFAIAFFMKFDFSTLITPPWEVRLKNLLLRKIRTLVALNLTGKLPNGGE